MQKNWTRPDVEKIYQQTFADLMFQAQQVHREYHDPNKVQISTLLSIKTGGCPENCAYCPQSAHYNTGLKREAMMPLDEVINAAKKAKENGASRFCMGAAWRSPPKKDLPKVIEMVKAVKKLGLESCVTLGMLNKQQAQDLKDGGVDYVNHNLDTSEEHYKKIISTRGYQDRLDTLENVRETGMKVCCGGILGMGETIKDRFDLLIQLANMDPYPESVPINQLIAVSGTPLEKQKNVDEFEFVRVIATARIMMPKTMVRLSAGRNNMSATMQSLCFLAGANSIHYGEKLLTTDLPAPENDLKLMQSLGINTTELRAPATDTRTASVSDRQ